MNSLRTKSRAELHVSFADVEVSRIVQMKVLYVPGNPFVVSVFVALKQRTTFIIKLD
jgi:hypothetical protein